MPVIVEEEIEGELAAPDFANLLDLGDPAFTSAADARIGAIFAEASSQSVTGMVSVEYDLFDSDQMEAALTLNVSSFLPYESMGEWHLPEAIDLGLEEPDYAKFENVCPHAWHLSRRSSANIQCSGYHNSRDQKSHVIIVASSVLTASSLEARLHAIHAPPSFGTVP